MSFSLTREALASANAGVITADPISEKTTFRFERIFIIASIPFVGILLEIILETAE